MEQEYIYAVARIKARELSLLTQQDLDRLMACKTPAECFRALADKGWGAGGETSAEAIFAAEEEKTWALMHELLPDLTPFSVLLYPIDFNNMKAAVKCTVTNAEPHNVFMSGSTVEPEKCSRRSEKMTSPFCRTLWRKPQKGDGRAAYHARRSAMRHHFRPRMPHGDPQGR